MYNRLLDNVNTNIILSPYQFGGREKPSIYMTLLKLMDDISEEFNNNNFSVGVFIDLSKAFDTIKYILIKKLNMDWLKHLKIT